MKNANLLGVSLIGLCFAFSLAQTDLYKLGTGASKIKHNRLNKNHAQDNYNLRIIDSIPAPPGEMRMGLTEDGNYLWIFTNTTNSYSSFYKIRKSDGLIVRQFYFPDTTPRYNIGLTMVNGYLYTTEFFPSRGNIHILDTLGNLTRTFNTGYDTRGLAWDGTNLWTTETDSQSIIKMDTLGNIFQIYKNNGSIQWFMDITWGDIDSTIWANDDAFSLNINEISTITSPFYVIQSFDHPAPPNDIPEGITYCNEPDGGYLYTSAAYSSFIWKIKVHDGAIAESKNKEPEKFQFGPVAPTLFKDFLSISYKIFETQSVSINLYGADGKKASSIFNGQINPGNYKVLWSGNDDSNQKLPEGVYFIKFKSGIYQSVQKVVKLK